MITNREYLQLNQMFKDTLKDTLRNTLKEEFKIAWETYSKDFQEFVVDHIQKLYDEQVAMKLDINYVKADLGLVKADLGVVKADVSKLKNDVKDLKTDINRIDIRIKTRKKYD